MVLRSYLAVAAWVLWPALAAAAPVATIQTIEPYTDVCDHWGDHLLLTIREDGRETMRREFCSAYGNASAEVVTDMRGAHYLLLQYAEGHGTNARSDYLTVYRIEAAGLVERARTLISIGAGPHTRWTYKYEVRRQRMGGLELRLQLYFEGEGEVDVLPDAAHRKISIDPFP